jgi:eukaryotic-like serine/threonine-protein kinase
MKRCLQCNRVEVDDALTFCRADGMPLVRDSGVVSDDAGTLKFGPAPAAGGTETRILPHTWAADEALGRQTAPTALLGGRRTSGNTRELSKPKTRRVIIITVATLLAVTIAAYAYYQLAPNGGAAISSVAVLPFQNASGDPNLDYLSDGLSESVIDRLSQLPQLKVVSRSSSFKFRGADVDVRDVAHKLGVRAVVTGRVVRVGDSLTVRAEMVDAGENRQLWSEQYNPKGSDVLAVQREIAREVSERLRLRLTGEQREQLAKRPTESLKAFQYYMQGQASTQRRTREDLLTAISFYEKAIGEDQNYALAYAGLADVYDNLGARTYIPPTEGRRKAEEAARKALALDENLAEAHAMLGQTYTDFAPYDFALADRELHRAIELSPSLAIAHQHLGGSFMRQGRLDEGLAEYLKARELDPLSPIIARQQALGYHLKRDFAQALGLLRQANELGPAFSVTWEIGVYVQNGLFNETLAELEKAKRERKNDPLLIYFTGLVYAAQGKRAEALRVIKELKEMSGASLSQAHSIAKIYAALNEKELAFSWLERGLAAGAITVFYKDEPVWDPIRGDPRFRDLLRRMGIPQ